jgi:hypothetical protein
LNKQGGEATLLIAGEAELLSCLLSAYSSASNAFLFYGGFGVRILQSKMSRQKWRHPLPHLSRALVFDHC